MKNLETKQQAAKLLVQIHSEFGCEWNVRNQPLGFYQAKKEAPKPVTLKEVAEKPSKTLEAENMVGAIEAIKQDYFKAVELYQKACELDNGNGCANLGVMYKDGTGVEQDDFKAVEYYQKACGLDNGIGCAILGLMYENGKGVRQSDTKALEYYGEACDLKTQLGCENYAKSKDR